MVIVIIINFFYWTVYSCNIFSFYYRHYKKQPFKIYLHAYYKEDAVEGDIVHQICNQRKHRRNLRQVLSSGRVVIFLSKQAVFPYEHCNLITSSSFCWLSVNLKSKLFIALISKCIELYGMHFWDSLTLGSILLGSILPLYSLCFTFLTCSIFCLAIWFCNFLSHLKFFGRRQTIDKWINEFNKWVQLK